MKLYKYSKIKRLIESIYSNRHKIVDNKAIHNSSYITKAGSVDLNY